jgi:hypothetical protein
MHRPAVMGKASRGASGNNRQSVPHAINVIVSRDCSCQRRRHCHDRWPAAVRKLLDQRIAERVEPPTQTNLGTLAYAQDALRAQLNRTALIMALERQFGCVQIFSDELAFAKCCQKEWPNQRMDQVVVNIVRKRGLKVPCVHKSMPRIIEQWPHGRRS